MNRALFLFLILMFSAAPLTAQQRQVTVRLFSTQALSTVRILPRAETTIDGIPIKTATQISAAATHVAIQGRATAFAKTRVTGSFVMETPMNPPAQIHQPLDIYLEGNHLRFVIAEPLEDYVAAVLAGEAGSFQSVESLKAMAVAIRTFAVRFEGRHRSQGYDFCDTTHCQDFRFSGVTDRLRDAVESTEGELLWFDGKPAATYYHQDCGGHTEDAGSVWPGLREPYLRAQQDSFCLAKGRNDWTTEITAEELRQAVGANVVQIAGRTDSGRVRQLRLSGGKTALMSAEDFRLSIGRALGWNRIRSDQYEIRGIGSGFRFEGHGAGHGVGLCQAGAAQMGASGRSYRDILVFYYPGTKLGITAQGLAWTRASGERVDLQTTRPDTDGRIIPIGDRLTRLVEQELNRRFSGRPAIRVFPSVAVFRNSTGEPGWIAASTRGTTVRLQPLETLTEGAEKTLHHELMHVLIEQSASPNLPRWFREGLVLALTDSVGAVPRMTVRPRADIERSLLRPQSREELFKAYADAKALVAELIAKYGKPAVLSWVESGSSQIPLLERRGGRDHK